MNEDLILGLDIGGTKTKLGLFDTEMKLMAKTLIKTNRNGFDSACEDIAKVARQLMADSGIPKGAVRAAGISSPGPLSPSTGVVNYIATLGWKNEPLKEKFESAFNIPVFLDKDTNCAALAEQRIGAGKGMKHLVYITLSTGIGSGIIIDGKLHYGKHEAAGEIGHICVERGGRKCECGCLGCLQAYASGESIARIANEYVKSGALIMPEGAINSEAVALAARNGNACAAMIWNEAGARIGQAVSILLQLVDVEAVVFGGGLVNAWELFYDSMEQAVRSGTYAIISENMKLIRAELGSDSCLYGAAMLAVYS